MSRIGLRDIPERTAAVTDAGRRYARQLAAESIARGDALDDGPVRRWRAWIAAPRSA